MPFVFQVGNDLLHTSSHGLFKRMHNACLLDQCLYELIPGCKHTVTFWLYNMFSSFGRILTTISEFPKDKGFEIWVTEYDK